MNILKYRGKTVKRDILFWISGLCLTKCIQSIQQNRGRTLLTKHLLSCRRKVAYCGSWKESVFSFLLVSLALPFHRLQLSSSSSVELFCVLIPDTVTGTLITARLQTLTRKRIDCAGVVTNIALCSQTHYKVFNRGTRRGFLCVPIKNVSESYSQHLWQPWEMKFPWTEWWILERPKNCLMESKTVCDLCYITVYEWVCWVDETLSLIFTLGWWSWQE